MAEMTLQSQPKTKDGSWLDGFINLLDDITYLALIGLILTVLFQVVARNFFSHGFPWTDELARWLQITLVFLAVPVLTREGAHLSVPILTEMLSLKIGRLLDVVASVFALGFSAVFLYSFTLQMLDGWDIPTPVLDWPNALFFIGLPIGLTANALLLIRLLYRTIKGQPGQPGQPSP